MVLWLILQMCFAKTACVLKCFEIHVVHTRTYSAELVTHKSHSVQVILEVVHPGLVAKLCEHTAILKKDFAFVKTFS